MPAWMVLCLLGVLACACGDDSPGAGGSAGAAGSAGTAGSGGSAGSGGNAGSGGLGALPDDVEGDGFVFASQGPSGWTLRASFGSWEPSPLCTFSDEGPCRIDTCAPATVYAAGGRVGVAIGDAEYTLDSTSSGLAQRSGSGALWAPGEIVRFFIEGGTVPAVDESVTAPGPFTLTAPPADGTFSVPRSQSLTARWTGGQHGTVVIALTGKTPAGQDVQVKCSFESASGAGTIPVSALSRLAPGEPGYLVALAEGYKVMLVEKWLLRVAARTEGVTVRVAYE